MKTTEIKGKGGRSVKIGEQDGKVINARLYVNNGETACHQTFSGKTMKGAIKWADKILGGSA